jgi:predicted transposase YbfD/YdcC
VKGNQPTLFRELQRIIVEEKPLDHFEVFEKGHGRESWWSVHVFRADQNAVIRGWKGLKRVVHVHKMSIKNGKESHNDRLYISDHQKDDAAFFHSGIRGHWTIENSLHWTKDVVHGEDKNGFRLQNAPVNVAVFSSFAINIHRKNGHHSITDGQIIFGANVNNLFSLIRT